MGPKANMKVLIGRGEFGHRDTDKQGRHHVKKETDSGVMNLQGKEC